MQNLADYVMRGRRQAIWLALLFAAFPLLGWLGDAIVALVTLRKGSKEGGIILLWVFLPSVIIALSGYPLLSFYNIGGSLVVYCLALLLRATNSWSLVLQAAMIIGVIIVIILHFCLPELGVRWVKDLQAHLKGMSTRFGMAVDMKEASMSLLMQVAIGVQMALLSLNALISLFFGRWWQASLYNPQGLAVELREVRFGFVATGLLIVLILAALSGATFALDSLPILVLPFLLAGLSVVHYVVTATQASRLWLVVLYSLLMLLFPYCAAGLIIVALVDVGLNIRHRL